LLGWGKPTPVNPLRWRNKDLANVMVSLAGIMANTFIAAVAFTILKVMIMNNADSAPSGSLKEPVLLFLHYLMVMNVSLAVFNLLPFPPLDGSKVLETFLPENLRPVLDFLEQYGYVLLLLFIWMRFTSAIIRPVIEFVYFLLYLGT